MATPTFAVNGGGNIPGIVATWQRVVKTKETDGTVIYQDWSLHLWSAATMPMTTFLTLQDLQGQVLTSIDTTDLDDINNGATYTDVELGLVTCGHVGLRANGVQIEFRIKAN